MASLVLLSGSAFTALGCSAVALWCLAAPFSEVPWLRERFGARIAAYRLRLQDLKRRREALREASPDQDRAMVEKYGERLIALGQRQGRIGMRFAADPAIWAALQEPAAAD
jgi:hypothetical protein